MRKVESDMIKAIRERRNYRCANTVVDQANPDIGYAEVRLHGSRIARLNYLNGIIELDDCGYRTATTKSRLNALINAFTKPGQAIYQRNFKWFWGDGQAWDGGCLATLRM
ncbi:MAG: hypothetical protein EB075_14155 [Bacteroidetes bacterium]|nr:hypothetical protein [Bacteroidota bacterium]